MPKQPKKPTKYSYNKPEAKVLKSLKAALYFIRKYPRTQGEQYG